MVEGPTADEPTILRFPKETIISKHELIDWAEKEVKAITTKAGWKRTKFAVAAIQNGELQSTIFGSDNLNRTELLPLERVGTGARLSKRINLLFFVRKKLSSTEVRLDIVSREDHAFDPTKTTW
ncbi:hypothetical protein SCUP515_02238 [Seiridium cupressi]